MGTALSAIATVAALPVVRRQVVTVARPAATKAATAVASAGRRRARRVAVRHVEADQGCLKISGAIWSTYQVTALIDRCP